MPFHKTLGDDQIHRLYDQVYADDTARDADTTWNGDSANIGKTIFVTGDSTVFLLLTVTPTWFEFGGAVAAPDTIYNADSDISADRIVTAPSALELTLRAFDLTPSNFTVGSDITIEMGVVHIEVFTGDGVGGTTAISRLHIDTTIMQVMDQINSKGLVYTADYSGNFTARSLVDKAYVDAAILAEDFWSRTGTVITSETAGDDLHIGGKIGIGAAAVLYALEISNTTPLIHLKNTRTVVGIGYNLGGVLINAGELTKADVGALKFTASHNWTDTSSPTQLIINITPVDTTVPERAMLIDHTGVVTVDTTVFEGAETFSTSTDTATLGPRGCYLCDDTTAARTLTISSADIAEALKGSDITPWVFEVRDISGGAGTNAITIDTEGAETINGEDSIEIAVDYGSVVLVCDGSNLFIRSHS